VKKIRPRVPGIPHLQLFGQLADLRNYRVRGVMAGKIILAEEAGTKKLVVFKTLHKAPAVYKKAKTSLLPINIAHMVKLLKYFETDDCVYLMLEYCSAGLLLDVVRPLLRQQQEISFSTSHKDSPSLLQGDCPEGRATPLKRQTSVLKPSESFIRDRQQSVQMAEVDSDSDSLGELSVVHTGLSGLLVVEGDQIEHFDKVTDEETPMVPRVENPVVRSSQAMLETVTRTLSASKEAWTEGSSVLDQLDSIEVRIKQHMQGNLVNEEATIATESEPSGKVQPSSPLAPTQPSSSSPLTTPPPTRPPVLRTLSELLPQCPIEELQDATLLPDRLIRTWAAELAQVLASLHYREILIKDLNPKNVLLDQHGHVKLTYQCEWVSVDTGLNSQALEENYCAPEVISAGDLTPAADWWSYGALLHLLYCGTHPASALPTGVDASIPLHFDKNIPPDAAAFIGELLQPRAEVRLGAGSCGSNDVRLHPFFKAWNWDTMSWL